MDIISLILWHILVICIALDEQQTLKVEINFLRYKIRFEFEYSPVPGLGIIQQINLRNLKEEKQK